MYNFTTWFFLKPYLTILYLPNCLIGLIYILLGGFRKIYWNPKIVWLKTSLYMEFFIYFLQESFTVLLWIQCIYSILIKVFFCLQRSRVIYGVLPHQSIQLDHLTRTAQDIIIIIIIIIIISISIIIVKNYFCKKDFFLPSKKLIYSLLCNFVKIWRIKFLWIIFWIF